MQPEFQTNLMFPGSGNEQPPRIQHFVNSGILEHFDTVTNKITPCDCPIARQ